MDTLFLAAQVAGNDIDSNFNWPLSVFLMSFFLALAMTLSVVAWQVAATWRARMSVAREAAYRTLAEQSASAITRTAGELSQARESLARLEARTAAIEQILKDVG